MSNENVPVIPPRPPRKKKEPNPVVAKCGKCGIELREVMMFSCNNPNCPIQPQVEM